MLTTIHENMIDQLKHRLQRELPGLQAHRSMAPPGRLDHVKRYVPRPDARLSGVLILMYPEANTLHFPLIIRPENTGVHSGQVALPGGRKDQEDQDVIETALREAWEEIGVNVGRSQVLGKLSEIYIPVSNFIVYPTIAYLDEKPKFLPSIHEVAQMLHINLEDFQQEEKKKQGEVQVRNHRIQTPYYDLEGKIVWGATAMILAEFQSILEELQ